MPTSTSTAEQGQGPAAPGRVPPNASRVTAEVKERDVWPPGSLAGEEPPVDPETTLHSVTLEILTSTPADPDLDDLARPGSEITAFTSDELESGLVGKTVSALLRLEGGTQGVRWRIEEVEVVSAGDETG